LLSAGLLFFKKWYGAKKQGTSKILKILYSPANNYVKYVDSKNAVVEGLINKKLSYRLRDNSLVTRGTIAGFNSYRKKKDEYMK
jgi:hypothetical protein